MTIAVNTLIALALISQSQDGAEIKSASAQLQASSSTIRSVRMEYSKTWTPNVDYFDAIGRAAPSSDTADLILLYAYPSMRLDSIDHRMKDGKPHDSAYIVSVHNDRTYTLHVTDKQFDVRSGADPVFFSRLPIDAFGLRMIYTQNTPITDFLEMPEICSISGREHVNGEAAITIDVGPNIPKSLLSATTSGWNDKTIIRVSLGVDRGFMPLQIHVSTPHENGDESIYTVSAQEFAEVKDESRGSYLWLPRRVSFTDSSSTATWSIKSISLNPHADGASFIPQAPSDFPKTGDDDSQSQQLRESAKAISLQRAKEGRQLLASAEPTIATSDRLVWIWRIGVPVILVCLLATFLWKRIRS